MKKRDQGIDMLKYLMAALTLTSIGFASATPAVAQGYESAAGWGGGVLINTSLNDGATVSGELLDLKPDPTWIVSAHYDRWFGSGNVGIRARGGFTKPTLPWVQGDREIRVYMGDLGLLLRPVAPAEGRSVLPFLAGGVGFINWGLGDGPPTTFDPAGVTYDGSQAFDFVASAGVGFDIITPWHWGEGPLVIRLEAQDYLQFSSPFDPANPDDGDLGMIHNAAVILGLHTGMGVLRGGR
jgi:hypothetical protein